MDSLVLKKHPLTRAAHYFFLLPFLPALQPLLVNYRLADMIIYAAGVVLVVFLVIFGNQRPLLRTGMSGLSLYLHYRHNAEYHPFNQIKGYRRLSPNKISLISRDHSPVVLRLKGRDLVRLVNRLEEEQIHAIQK